MTLTGRHWRGWRFAALAAAALGSVSPTARAHDFVLRPSAFVVEEGQPVQLALLIGHGQDRARWQTDARRILRFEGRSEAGIVDYRAAVGGRSTAAIHRLHLASPGTHVLLFESAASRSELPADRFERYLVEEGLTQAQEARLREGAITAPGRELYSRRAKALIQVGAGSLRHAVHVVRPQGQTLEIVTETNPYVTAGGEPLPVRVFYDGRPLPGALLKLWDLNGEAIPAATARTNGEGRAVFVRPTAGEWQLGVVWTRALPPGTWAQFETVFASLTFGTAR